MIYALQFVGYLASHLKSALDASALVLAIANGLFLPKFYLRDRPKLRVRPVDPDYYQRWFQMPEGEHCGSKTRRYGFLIYIDIANRGLRDTRLDSWWIRLGTEGQGADTHDPLNMPEPRITIGGLDKFYPVLGQKGVNCDGSTLIKPGCSISGMAFFEYECYGDESWSPVIRDRRISVVFGAKGIFGQACKCVIELTEKKLDEITEMAPSIHLTSMHSKS